MRGCSTISLGAAVADASDMMTFPVANPLIATGFPLTSSISFGVPGGMMIVVGILLAVVIVGVGAAPSIARSWRQFVARGVRTPQVALRNLATRGAHR
jgi:hypothetical protein